MRPTTALSGLLPRGADGTRQGRNSSQPQSRRRVMRPLALLLLAVFILCCLSACTGQRSGHAPAAEKRLLRADPGYLQWLEKQSMLGAAPGLAAQVSGSPRIWSGSAASRSLSLLLNAAPNWLEVDPHTVGSSRSPLQALAAPGFAELLSQLGLGGIYLAPTGERGDIWQSRPKPGTADNVISLHLDKNVGNADDLAALRDRLDSQNLQLGGELPPAATGLGPDFMLQARHAPRFDGLYAMISVPQTLWKELPVVPDEWECLPLKPQAVAALQKNGLLPAALLRQQLPWATPGGWAATGEIRGADGQIRRWVYRYADDVLRPVLLWQDPSCQARRLLSAAIIQHTGLQGQTLAGLRLEALMGLDIPPQNGNEEPFGHAQALPRQRLTPGFGALIETGREVHRYGGWAVQADALPPSLLEPVLRAGLDISRDTLTAPLAEYALLSGDARPLGNALRRALDEKLPQNRLARGLHGWQGVDWRLLRDLPDGESLYRRALALCALPEGESRCWTTPTSLAARALGLNKTSAATAEQRSQLQRAALALLSCRAGLPGPFFVSLQELTGALDIPRTVSRDILPSRGLVPLQGDGVTDGAAPAAELAFGSLSRQLGEQNSFLLMTARLLLARRAAGLAQGRLLSVANGPDGCLSLCSALPEGGYWITVLNFSGHARSMELRLPASGGSLLDVFSGQSLQGDGHLALTLAPREARHLVMDARAATNDGRQEESAHESTSERTAGQR